MHIPVSIGPPPLPFVSHKRVYFPSPTLSLPVSIHDGLPHIKIPQFGSLQPLLLEICWLPVYCCTQRQAILKLFSHLSSHICAKQIAKPFI